MTTPGADINQEQSSIARQRRTTETFCENEVLRMAFQELQRSFQDQVQKIWEMINGSGDITLGAVKQDGKGSRRSARKQVLRQKTFRRSDLHDAISKATFTERWSAEARKAAVAKRRRQRGKLNNHICTACGSITGCRPVGHDSSSFISTDQDVEDNRSDNAQKVSDQSGASKTFVSRSSGPNIIIEEKPIDKPKSTVRRQRRAKPKADLPRTRLSYGALSRTKLDTETDRKIFPKRLSETKFQSRVAEIGGRGLAVDTDPNEGSAFYVSPIMGAMTGQEHWSDDLIDLGGESSYSGNESNMSLNLIKIMDGNSSMPAPNSSSEHWVSQYPRDWWRTSYSSSSSVRDFMVDSEFLHTNGSQCPQPMEKLRGRLEYRADVGKRIQDECKLVRKRLEHSRIKSLPDLDLNSKKSNFASSTKTAVSNLQEITGDVLLMGEQI